MPPAKSPTITIALPTESLDKLQLEYDNDNDDNDDVQKGEAFVSSSSNTGGTGSNISSSAPPPVPPSDDCDLASTIDPNGVRGLFDEQQKRGKTLQRRLARLNGLQQRLSAEHTELEAAYQTARDDLNAAEETVRRLQDLEKELEKRFERLVETHQLHIEAEAAQRVALSTELKVTVEEMEKEQRRVHEEAATLRAKRHALAAQLRVEFAEIDKEKLVKEEREKAAEAEIAGYKGNIEELEGAFEAMEVEIKERRVMMHKYDELNERTRKLLAETNSGMDALLKRAKGAFEERKETGEEGGNDGGDGGDERGGEKKGTVTTHDLTRLQKKLKVIFMAERIG
eukprot:evm.model.NODE_1488_length_24496_cov_18.726200.3